MPNSIYRDIHYNETLKQKCLCSNKWIVENFQMVFYIPAKFQRNNKCFFFLSYFIVCTVILKTFKYRFSSVFVYHTNAAIIPMLELL